MAGWLTAVELSRSAEPLKQTSGRLKPRMSDASSKSLRAAGRVSKSCFPIPTLCAPWPGNRKAVLDMKESPSLLRLAPGLEFAAPAASFFFSAAGCFGFEFLNDDVVEPAAGVLGCHSQGVLDGLVARAT